MAAPAPVREVQTSVPSLNERIENQVQELSDILDRPHSRAELAAATARLSSLVHAFMQGGELLEKLLRHDLPEARRQQIRQTLAALSVSVEERWDGFERQRQVSNELIRRAMALISRAQQIISRRSPAETGSADDHFLEAFTDAGGPSVQ